MNRQVFELASSLLMSSCKIGEMNEDFYTECSLRKNKNKKAKMTESCARIGLTVNYCVIGFEKANTLSSFKWVGRSFQRCL